VFDSPERDCIAFLGKLADSLGRDAISARMAGGRVCFKPRHHGWTGR